jgi:hypothetical protein
MYFAHCIGLDHRVIALLKQSLAVLSYYEVLSV